MCIGCYLPVSLLIKNNSTPKCSDKDVTLTVVELLRENVTHISPENRNLTNIITTEKNKEMNSCECKATLPGSYWYNRRTVHNPTVFYTIEKTDDGVTMINILTGLY